MSEIRRSQTNTAPHARQASPLRRSVAFCYQHVPTYYSTGTSPKNKHSTKRQKLCFYVVNCGYLDIHITYNVKMYMSHCASPSFLRVIFLEMSHSLVFHAHSSVLLCHHHHSRHHPVRHHRYHLLITDDVRRRKIIFEFVKVCVAPSRDKSHGMHFKLQ